MYCPGLPQVAKDPGFPPFPPPPKHMDIGGHGYAVAGWLDWLERWTGAQLRLRLIGEKHRFEAGRAGKVFFLLWTSSTFIASI